MAPRPMIRIVSSQLMLVAACVSLAAIAVPAAPAQLSSLLQGKKNQPVGPDAVLLQQGVLRDYVSAKGNVDKALVKFAEAYGKKEQAAALEASAQRLAGGATSEHDLKENAKLSEEAQKEVEAQIAMGTELSTEGKKIFASGLAPFALGVKATVAMPDEMEAFSDAAKNQLSAAPIIDKVKLTSVLKPGMWLMMELPGYTAKLTTGFRQIALYARKEKLPDANLVQDVL